MVDANHLVHTGAGCFAVVLANLQKEADVAHILERRIIESLRRPFVVEGTELHISPVDRGRNTRYRAPPAQIPAGAIRAPGSHLG